MQMLVELLLRHVWTGTVQAFALRVVDAAREYGQLEAVHSELPALRIRTPAPPPFSGMNSTPAFWRTWSRVVRVEA